MSSAPARRNTVDDPGDLEGTLEQEIYRVDAFTFDDKDFATFDVN